MSPLKLSNPFRRSDAAPTLKRRAAALKSDLLNLTARPTTPNPLPAPGSPEAIEAWGKARSEFDRLTHISEAEYAALRIGDSLTLWTTDWVKAAQRGDFTRFTVREMLAARAKTVAELADLLVITTRRDLRFAEAQRQTGIRELYALAYPDGEDPEPLPEPEGDYAHIIIAEHRAAYAAWSPLGDAWNNAKGGTAEYEAAKRAEAEPHRIQAEAFGELIDTRATTVGGLVALAGYLPGAVFDANCVEVEEDARRALRSMCNSVLRLAENGMLAASTSEDPIVEPDLRDASINQLARFHDCLQGLVFITSTACNAPMAWSGNCEQQNSICGVLEIECQRLDDLAEHVAQVIASRRPRNDRERDERLSTMAKRQFEVFSKIDDHAIVNEIATAWGDPAA